MERPGFKWSGGSLVGTSLESTKPNPPVLHYCEQCDPDKKRMLLKGTDQSVIGLWEERRCEKHAQKTIEEDNSKRQRKKKAKHSAKHDQRPIPDENINELEELVDQGPANTPFALTDECHHYTTISDVPWDIQKYWQQRHSIFSCYNEGIFMTDDAWFGVTPEPIANKIAEDLAAMTDPSRTIMIDMFGGVGGNSIAFALSNRWSQVIAIEKDASAIACGQNNAVIYGVSEYITWVNDDCFSYLLANQASIDPSKTVIFASPPWGGPGYTNDEIFNLSTMQPYSVEAIHDACKYMDLAIFLPRTSDLRQLAKLPQKGKKAEVVQYCMEGASKALVAYIPAATVLS